MSQNGLRARGRNRGRPSTFPSETRREYTRARFVYGHVPLMQIFASNVRTN